MVEPRGIDCTTRAVGEPSSRAALRELLRDPAIRWLVLGAGFASFTTLAYVTWLPAFLVRTHGLTLVQAGVCVALIGIVSALLGNLASGSIERRLYRWRPAWTMAAPALGMSIALLAGIAVFSWPVSARFALGELALPQALVWSAVFGFASALWTPVVFARTSELVAPNRRAMANGLLALGNTWIGFGLGPFFVGLSSDALSAWCGSDALRYALIGTMCLGVIAPLAFLRAGQGRPESAASAPGQCQQPGGRRST